MKYLVLNRISAQRYSEQTHDETSIIISITNNKSCSNKFDEMSSNGIRKILRLAFNDVSRDYPACIQKSDVEAIVKFVNDYKNDVELIIVHCDAGISRSAGVCGAIMKYFEGSDAQIFGDKKFLPNMTCYLEVLRGFHNNEM